MEKLIFCIFVALFFQSQAIVNYAPAVPGCSGALHPMPNFDIQRLEIFVFAKFEFRLTNCFKFHRCLV